MTALDRFQPFLLVASIAAGLGLHQLAPGVASASGPVVSIGVFVLIAVVMLGLDVATVAGSFRHRRFLAIAVGLNFVINPALAWALGRIFLSGQPDLRVGLLLFLVTPCIGWYLIFTELAGGDTGLGVSLLGVNVVLQVLLLPLYLFLFEGRAAGVEIGGIVVSIATFLVGPALLAAAVRALTGRSGLPIDEVLEVVDRFYVKTVALVAVIVAMFASQAQLILDNPTVVLRLVVPMIAFFVVAFVVAIVVAARASLPDDQTALLVFTTTSRNSEASLAIAATAFASPLVALTVVVGPVIELPLLVLMVRALNRLAGAPASR